MKVKAEFKMALVLLNTEVNSPFAVLCHVRNGMAKIGTRTGFNATFSGSSKPPAKAYIE